MSKVNTVWVLGETPDTYAALCAVARRLGDKVEAVVIGNADDAQAVKGAGADAVLLAAKQDGALVEDCVAAVAAGAVEQKPDAILLATSKRMRLAAARIAASAHTRVINDATRVWVDDDGSLLAEHMVFGGTAYSIEKAKSAPAVILLGDGLLLNEPPFEGNVPAASVVDLPAVQTASGLKLVETKPRTVESVNLAAARRVVSVGRGIENEADLQLINDFAQAIEAEVGCTRPIAEGVNWMSRERYIGVSGAMLKPDLFVAIGVSGQIQHMVGANTAKTIVAINKDKNAPVFKQADYGIVGDLYEVVPKLVAGLKA